MPSLSILESIAAAILTQLDTITAGATYYHTPTVTRPTRLGGYTPVDGQLVLVQTPASPEPDMLLQGNYVRLGWTQRFHVVFFVVPSDAATAAIDTTINERRADIEYALMADKSWGGLAIDTRLVEFDKWQGDESEFAWGNVIIDVDYRVNESNPRTNGI
jgi:hypothetical protein